MRGMLLAVVALAGTALVAQEATPTFEVASVRKRGQLGQSAPTPPTPTSPDRFYRAGETLAFLVRLAYDLQPFQVVDGPDWVRTDLFEIHAKADGEVSPEQMQLMLRSLLEERFKLVLRREQREMRHLALVLARADGRLGPGLQRCGDSSVMREPRPVPNPAIGYLLVRTCAPLTEITARGTASMGTPVLDRTGLTGRWNYELLYGRQGGPTAAARNRPAGPYAELPPFDVAVREQLGLKLEPGRGPVEVLIIDSVQQPTEN